MLQCHSLFLQILLLFNTGRVDTVSNILPRILAAFALI